MCFFFLFFKQKTADEMRISDWSSDVCSSDLLEWMARLVRVRPCTVGTSHSALRLTLYLGVAGARLPSKAPSVVSVNSLSMYMTPPSKRKPLSGSDRKSVV